MDEEVARLADETIRLSARLAEHTMLLAVAIQYASMSAWVNGYRQAQADLDARLERQERTERLIRRGVPPEAAARGLRVL
jgi:hypothetical protein